MTIKAPTKLFIGAHEFPFSFRPITDPIFGGDAVGITHFDQPECGIYIADGQTLTETLEVVWHEITHAVNHAADIEDVADEETIADAHGRIWSQLWVNNPTFARWWMAQCTALRKFRAKG